MQVYNNKKKKEKKRIIKLLYQRNYVLSIQNSICKFKMRSTQNVPTCQAAIYSQKLP